MSCKDTSLKTVNDGLFCSKNVSALTNQNDTLTMETYSSTKSHVFFERIKIVW